MCGHKVTLSRPSAEPLLHCDKCGRAFAVQAASGPAAGAPPRAAARAGARRRKSSLPIVLITVFAVAGLFVLLVLVHHYAGRRYYEGPDEQGRPVKGWYTLEEIRRFEDTADREYRKSLLPPPPTGLGRSGFFEEEPNDEGPDVTVPDPVEGPMAPDDANLKPLAPGDEKLKLITWRREPSIASEDGAFGRIVGTVRNESGRTLRVAVLHVQVVGAGGKPLCGDTTTCRFIPPGTSVTFDAGYKVPPGQLAGLDIRTAARNVEQANDQTASWMIDTRHALTEVRDERFFVVRGQTRNPKAFGVAQAWVYGEFFRENHTRLGAARGKLEDYWEGRIQGRRTARYVIEFDSQQADVLPETVAYFELRLIGKRD
jgi:hypothetical protein